MEHLRNRGAALVVALLLLLSVAGVAGAASVVLPATAAPQALDQVAKDHGDENADEDQNEDTTEDTNESTEATDTTEPTTEDTAGAQGEHGALVSAVAQNEACVGGEHMNHGWAVSQVARGLLVPDAVTGCPIWAPSVAATTPTTDATTASPGKSGDHRQDAVGKANKANKTNRGHHGRP